MTSYSVSRTYIKRSTALKHKKTIEAHSTPLVKYSAKVVKTSLQGEPRFTVYWKGTFTKFWHRTYSEESKKLRIRRKK